MKIIKLLTVIIYFASNLAFANNASIGNETVHIESAPPMPYAKDENDGLGAGVTPIDNYAPLLVVTAIGIAGAIYYRQRRLIKK